MTHADHPPSRVGRGPLRRAASWWLGLSVWVGAPAWAADQQTVDAIDRCLRLQDAACAEALVETHRLDTSRSPALRGLAARVAFHSGDYPRATDLLEAAVQGGLAGADTELDLYRNTLHATAGWVEEVRGRARVRYRPGLDAILVEDAGQVLAETDRLVVPRIGAVPPGSTVVELYPDGLRFAAASSLTREDIETTGVVAISKWSRLLVATPRAIARGYPWRDTLSHEYLHLVVSHNSEDRAPVWLQEGIAKAFDGLWRGHAFTLEPDQETLLAEALAADALVPFAEMHPSLAKIKVFKPDGSIDREASAKRATLAYAQLATLILHAVERGGDDTVVRVLPRVGEGVDPFLALATEAGFATFDALAASWRASLVARGLIDRNVQSAPLVLDGGTDAEVDPVMASRRDLWNKLRLGDLLAARGRYKAALVEYEAAADADDPNSPARATRMAQAWMALGEPDRARGILRASVDNYPEHPLTHRLLGQLAKARGERAVAVDAFEQAVALDPFVLDDHAALRALYVAGGDSERVARQDEVLRILERGGRDEPEVPLHTRYGEVVPVEREGGPARAPDTRGLTGMAAPDGVVRTLDGDTLRLSDLRGRVVVVDFWATWCGPCRSIMPRLSTLAQAHGPEDLVVLGVSDETDAVVRRFLATEGKRGVSFAQRLALEDGALRAAYGVSSIPQLVVIDRKGKVAGVHVGAGDLEPVIARVEALIAGGGAEAGAAQ